MRCFIAELCGVVFNAEKQRRREAEIYYSCLFFSATLLLRHSALK